VCYQLSRERGLLLHLTQLILNSKLLCLTAITLLFATQSVASDTTYIKVHFLYGSRPKREFKDTEHHWFGGIHGGHVGIEVDSNYIIDFVPAGAFHIIEHQNNKHSRFVTHTVAGFWSTFGGDTGDMKRTTIVIPIDEQQKKKLDSIAAAYTSSPPYDYAFIGMRCAAAAYDVLAQIEVMQSHCRSGTYFRNFYPKRFRHHLMKKAKKEGWSIVKHEGCDTRVWEND
jgi:hypothetical protein